MRKRNFAVCSLWRPDAPSAASPRARFSNSGKFEDAAGQLAQAIEAFPSAFQQMTTVKRMSEDDRPLLDRMRSLAERPGLDAVSRIAIRFGLGKAFDDLGEYAEAMRHYEEGNRLRAMSERLDRAGAGRSDRQHDLALFRRSA